jgi:hypothetical protein
LQTASELRELPAGARSRLTVAQTAEELWDQAQTVVVR